MKLEMKYWLVYQTDILDQKDSHKNYSVDESFFCYKKMDNKFG